MKSILHITIAILCGFGVRAQMQNNTWVFGEGAVANFQSLTMSSVPYSTTGSTTFNALEGCASVSDYQTGALLFYTDGVRVFRADNSMATNQLLGYTSSAQNAIIVPRPQNEGHYYIVTISGYTTDGCPAHGLGLHYSEVDCSSGTCNMVGTLNIPLQIGGSPINLAFQNVSEAVTSTLHSDGSRYRVLAAVQNKSLSTNVLCSYLVGPNGIGISPTDTEPNSTLNFPMNNIKVSPSGQRYAVGGYQGMGIGTFDNTTGVFNGGTAGSGTSTFLVNTEANGYTYSTYGIEFSQTQITFTTRVEEVLSGLFSSRIQQLLTLPAQAGCTHYNLPQMPTELAIM